MGLRGGSVRGRTMTRGFPRCCRAGGDVRDDQLRVCVSVVARVLLLPLAGSARPGDALRPMGLGAGMAGL